MKIIMTAIFEKIKELGWVDSGVNIYSSNLNYEKK
jgi:hypothetical protein